jgi:hypothetical protein
LEAAPSKAVLHIDFIPLSPTQTQINASGSLDRTLLGTSVAGDNPLSISGTTSSRIVRGSNNQLNYTYNPTGVLNWPGRRYSFS